ncbi:hypothetical protein [Streptomyces sp. NPDC058086]|uniref:hypothetical protein n=1 Tax=Streptomyces sp. NPDC058086 TaxID=3346334 RepID=UPI0036E6C74E
MNDEHRLIYKAAEDAVLIAQCHYRYESWQDSRIEQARDARSAAPPCAAPPGRSRPPSSSG